MKSLPSPELYHKFPADGLAGALSLICIDTTPLAVTPVNPLPSPKNDDAVTIPVNLPLPVTVNALVGLVVPIPTLLKV
jgi:hypothetical protein